MAKGILTVGQFKARIAATAMNITDRTAIACRRVMVDGERALHVAADMGMDRSAISRACTLLKEANPAHCCPKCGRAIR